MLFARDVNAFVRGLSKDFVVFENGKQLVRSAGSVAANYIEANEALSRKDFIMRIKICRKEAKESRLWLNLLYASAKEIEAREHLIDEATQLMKIFGAILTKTGDTKF
jgi:four helix bundle protein